MVFEMMKGGDLSRFLREYGRLCDVEASQMLFDVTNALMNLHVAGVTHR